MDRPNVLFDTPRPLLPVAGVDGDSIGYGEDSVLVCPSGF